jgi:hypothetical protein
MRRRLLTLLVCLAAASVVAEGARAAGGAYTFAGGTPREQATVRQALEASSFDWGLVPRTIVIHIARGTDSYAVPGEIWLDADLVDSGKWAWGPIQHEYGHQVDFFLLDDAKRAALAAALQTNVWCYDIPTLAHDAYGCERFASTLSWAYWQSPDNALRPASSSDEAGAMAPAAFRSLLAKLIGAPSSGVATAPAGTKAFAPATKPHPAARAKPRPRAKRR